MDEVLDSISSSISQGSLYPAFMSCIALPDICGYLDAPKMNSKERYIDWFDKFMADYSGTMSGEEAYALRCTVLHNGELETTQYKIRSPGVILDKFILKADGSHRFRSTGGTINGIKMPNFVLINIPMFCADLIEAVKEWQKSSGKELGEHGDLFQIVEGPILLFGGAFRID